MASRMSQFFILVLTISSFTVAWPTSSSYTPPGAHCQDYTVPVTVTSLNFPWVAPKWVDDFGLINFVSEASSRTDDGFPAPIGAPISQTASYKIGATFCTPVKSTANSGKVLLATHGVGFDRSYWNPYYKPDQYNFVQYAIKEGYSVFFYDRLGIGASSKISGFTSQLNIQTAILASLTTTLRTSFKEYTLLTTAPTAIILLGHSLGSYITNALLATTPTIADAAIMTGHGIKGADGRIVLQGFAPRVANLQDPKFATFDAGYVTTGDVFANVNNFFKLGAYEPDVAEWSESHKQPIAIAELISITGPPLDLDASKFEGPALVVSGEFDFIFCGGFCPGELGPSFDALFAGAKDFETYVQPGSGHGLNFATNATGFFGVVFDYLGRSGL